MRSLSTFNFLATAFFSSSTESRLFTVSVNGPPVKGATVTEIKFVGVFTKLFKRWVAATILEVDVVLLLRLFVITCCWFCPSTIAADDEKTFLIWAPFGFLVTDATSVPAVVVNVLLSRSFRCGCNDDCDGHCLEETDLMAV